MVAPRGSKAGYSRAQFPHWDLIKGSCNTRDEVLQRDGQNVRINSHCAPVEGSWTSPYDGDVRGRRTSTSTTLFRWRKAGSAARARGRRIGAKSSPTTRHDRS